MTKWISVNDQLPEHGQNVLYVLDDMFFGQDVRFGMYLFEKKKHKFGNYGHSTDNQDCRVTHWMPLPELPGAENEE